MISFAYTLLFRFHEAVNPIYSKVQSALVERVRAFYFVRQNFIQRIKYLYILIQN